MLLAVVAVAAMSVVGRGHDGNGKLQIVGHKLAVQHLGCIDLSGQFHV
jgi:hypothetical protein